MVLKIETVSKRLQDEARTWLGTPWRHQARLKGAGVDCAGLCIGVGYASKMLPVMDTETWAPYANYSRSPNPERMTEALETFMVRVLTQERLPGDWAFIQWRTGRGRDMPMHLAMLAEGPNGPSLVHAYESVGRVVEQGLTRPWEDMILAWYRYPKFETVVEARHGGVGA